MRPQYVSLRNVVTHPHTQVNHLTEVVIPDSVSSIGDAAFGVSVLLDRGSRAHAVRYSATHPPVVCAVLHAD